MTNAFGQYQKQVQDEALAIYDDFVKSFVPAMQFFSRRIVQQMHAFFGGDAPISVVETEVVSPTGGEVVISVGEYKGSPVEVRFKLQYEMNAYSADGLADSTSTSMLHKGARGTYRLDLLSWEVSVGDYVQSSRTSILHDNDIDFQGMVREYEVLASIIDQGQSDG